MSSAGGSPRVPARDGPALVGLLAIAALVRAVAWSRTAVLFNDGPVFLAMAEAIGAGRWTEALAHPYHPLYPAFVAGVAALPVPIGLESAAIAVSIGGGLLTVAALFAFARDMLGRDVAWLVAWTAALHPWLVDFSADVMSDGLYMGWFALGIAGLGRMVVRPGPVNVVLCAVAGGLAYWTRPEGAGLWIVGGVLLVGVAVSAPERRRQALVAIAWLGAIAVLLAAPYVLGVERLHGEIALSQKKSVTGWLTGETRTAPSRQSLEEALPTLPLPEIAVRADGQGARLPARDPAGVVLTVGRVLATGLSALRFELIPFVLIGAWVLRRRPDRARIAWTIGVPILLYGGVLLLLVWTEGYVSRRHALPPLLPTLVLAALGAQTVLRWVRPERLGWERLRSQRALAVLLVAVLLIGWGPRDLRPRRADRAAVREAAEWLAEHRPGSGPVAAQKLRTAWYADADFVPLMPGRHQSQERYLRGRGARWVVIDEAKLGDHMGLAEGIGAWLEPVHTVSDGRQRVLVLALRPGAGAR